LEDERRGGGEEVGHPTYEGIQKEGHDSFALLLLSVLWRKEEKVGGRIDIRGRKERKRKGRVF